MSTFKDILYGVSLIESSGRMDVQINGIAFDSREVKPGYAFVAIKGLNTDGHNYIDVAIRNGATAIVSEFIPNQIPEGITVATTSNSARALGVMAANFYKRPSEKLHLVAVTGTNGKTTTVTLLFQLFRALGYNCGLISTVQNQVNDTILATTYTTPDAVTINSLLSEMQRKGCTHVFMEASSHAIVQERVSGLHIHIAIFTNISHDHLDYHKTFEEYIKAKKKLFDDLPKKAFALSNMDDRRGKVMLQNTKATKKSYSLKAAADFKGKILSNSLQGLEMELDGQTAWFQLIGEFNAYNLLAAYAAAHLLGEEQAEVITALTGLKAARGRFEQVPNRSQVIAIVDYAHTPDALENVLKTISGFRTRNETLYTLVGCGGDRDKTKRPEMARIATAYSDKVILTSDNPRSENPDEIIEEMSQGVSPAHFKKTLKVSDRKEAIKLAISLAQPRDIILIAGKGHETYQEIKGKRHHFDDREIAMEMFEKMND